MGRLARKMTDEFRLIYPFYALPDTSEATKDAALISRVYTKSKVRTRLLRFATMRYLFEIIELAQVSLRDGPDNDWHLPPTPSDFQPRITVPKRKTRTRVGASCFGLSRYRKTRI